MGTSRGGNSPPGETTFFFLALGVLVGVGGVVFLILQTFLGDSLSLVLAAPLGLVAHLVLIDRRYGLEPVGATRRNPDPEDHVLSPRERVVTFLIGLSCAGFAVGLHFGAPAAGLSRESMPVEIGILLGGTAALAFLIRAVYGVDHARPID